MAKNKDGHNRFSSEFGRFALNSAAVPEKFEEWMTSMYGISPRIKKRKKRR